MATIIFARLAMRFFTSVKPTVTTAYQRVLDVLESVAVSRMQRGLTEIERYRRRHPDPAAAIKTTSSKR